MSTDLKTQIRDYGEQLIDSQVPISESVIADLVDRVREVPPTRIPQRRSRNLWVAVSAAALVFVVVGALALMSSFSRTAGPADQPSATTVPQSTTVPETTELRTDAIPDLTNTVWERATGWEGEAPDWISAYPTGGYVAGGVNIANRYSADGLHWTETPFDPFLAEFEHIYILGTFAVADPAEGDSFNSEYRMPTPDWVWGPEWGTLLSFNDGVWSQLQIDWSLTQVPIVSGNRALIPGPDDASYVIIEGASEEEGTLRNTNRAVSAPRFFPMPNGSIGAYQEDGDFWLSETGSTFTRVAEFNSFAEGVGAPRAIDFHVLGDEVIGQRWFSGNWAWISTDGANWTQARQPEPDTDPEKYRTMHDTTWGLIVAATDSQHTQLAIWGSTDGRTWVSIPTSDYPLTGIQPYTTRFSVAHDHLFHTYNDSENQGVIWKGTTDP